MYITLKRLTNPIHIARNMNANNIVFDEYIYSSPPYTFPSSLRVFVILSAIHCQKGSAIELPSALYLGLSNAGFLLLSFQPLPHICAAIRAKTTWYLVSLRVVDAEIFSALGASSMVSVNYPMTFSWFSLHRLARRVKGFFDRMLALTIIFPSPYLLVYPI